MSSIRLPRLLAAAVVLAFAASEIEVADAACFEDVGCTNDHEMPSETLKKLSCDSLWMVRNTIFHEAGYCFHTDRAREVFSNDHCRYRDIDAKVPLNQFEQANVSRIREVEIAKDCPGPVYE